MAVMSLTNVQFLVGGTLLVLQQHIIVVLVPVKDMLSKSNVKIMEDGLGVVHARARNPVLNDVTGITVLRGVT